MQLRSSLTLAVFFIAPTALAADPEGSTTIRIATFNASLNRAAEGELIDDLTTPDDVQAGVIAQIIQVVRPDVLLINEFDYDENGEALALFQENYLALSQDGEEPITFPYAFTAESNTGIPSGFDLDNAVTTTANDAFGFGAFPGQYGMVILSMYPIEEDDIRTFQHFLWADMPGALLPDDPATAEPSDWYSVDELAVFRLSSKSHWDVPVDVDGHTIHVLASHPTPPVFDDPPTYPTGVDFNGQRNHDEIRFWADYIAPVRSRYIYDDAGDSGGLPSGNSFVIVGDMNADPNDGDGVDGAVEQILWHPLVNRTLFPASKGGPDAATRQGLANETQIGNPIFDTADFSDTSPGNLRADYVLPSLDLEMLDATVFWPAEGRPNFDLVGDYPFPSSDHRLVFIDVEVPGTAE